MKGLFQRSLRFWRIFLFFFLVLLCLAAYLFDIGLTVVCWLIYLQEFSVATTFHGFRETIFWLLASECNWSEWKRKYWRHWTFREYLGRSMSCPTDDISNPQGYFWITHNESSFKGKHVIISNLWFFFCFLSFFQQLCLHTFLQDDTCLKNNIELIISCARSAKDDITRNHVFMLLSSVARVSPEWLLEQIIDIFSLIGESSIKQVCCWLASQF